MRSLFDVISQRLIPTKDGKRIVAVEILLGTPLICDLILKGEMHKIKEVMQKSENIGMQTFDAALYYIYKAGHITLDEALRNADSQNNLRLRISLEEKQGGKQMEETSLSIAEDSDGTAKGGLSLTLE